MAGKSQPQSQNAITMPSHLGYNGKTAAAAKKQAKSAGVAARTRKTEQAAKSKHSTTVFLCHASVAYFVNSQITLPFMILRWNWIDFGAEFRPTKKDNACRQD